jgi:hypothetical protein
MIISLLVGRAENMVSAIAEKRKRRIKAFEPWPPKEYSLPDTIEAGRPAEQLGMFSDAPDDSKAARLARLLGTVPGVMTANRLEARR